jgi:uncharacterized protein YbbK (DUF523 family)/uncharacterized protein YbgA (DUF1722 family)
MRPFPPIRLGISSCLLGHKVRYDGTDKRDRLITGTLGKYFDFVPVCPEVAIGLGVPRPPIRLVGSVRSPRAVGVEGPALDVTKKLAAYGRQQARALDDVSGYILKSRSPSCGMAGVEVHARRARRKRGRGIYAAAFMAAQPLLPVEEEGRLGDARRRDNFLERVFAWRRWQALQARGMTPARLAAFHAAHELTLRAHGDAQFRSLGRLAARAGKRNLRRIAGGYARAFMAALARPATRARHAGVLARVANRFEERLNDRERAALRATLKDYRAGRRPLAAPLRLLQRHLRRHPDPWLARQLYLHPDPREFALRYEA